MTEDLQHWQAPPSPEKVIHQGHYCRLEPLNCNQHAQPLWQAFSSAEGDGDIENNKSKADQIWEYLGYGPFNSLEDFSSFIEAQQNDSNTIFFAVIANTSNRALGFLAYSRIQANAGAIEIAHVCFSPQLQKTTLATEAVYLLIEHSFALGYRRCEWKCNALNTNSKRAATRFGFQYEGRFRQAMVVKGKNRDTDWYSIIDKEWPRLQPGYQAWLSPDNFDADHVQRQALKDLLAAKN